MAVEISKRLWATGQWHDSNIGHAKILREVGTVGSSDYIIPRYDFTRGFKTSIPDNEVWKGDVSHLIQNSVQIYTDHSKLNGAVGSEIFS